MDRDLHKELKDFIKPHRMCKGISPDDLISDLFLYIHDNENELNLIFDVRPPEERIYYYKQWLANQARWICANNTNRYRMSANDLLGLSDNVADIDSIEEEKIERSVYFDPKEVYDKCLAGRHESIYRLYYMENNTLHEVAEITNLNVATVHGIINNIESIIKGFLNGNYQTKIDL